MSFVAFRFPALPLVLMYVLAFVPLHILPLGFVIASMDAWLS